MRAKKCRREDNNESNEKENTKTKKFGVGNKKHINDDYDIIIVVYMEHISIGDNFLKP